MRFWRRRKRFDASDATWPSARLAGVYAVECLTEDGCFTIGPTLTVAVDGTVTATDADGTVVEVHIEAGPYRSWTIPFHDLRAR